MDSNSGKMYGVVNGVYQCNQERTVELDERIYDRLWPSTPLQPQYSIRPVSTKIHFNLFFIALCIRIAVTVESTPPDKPHIT